MLLPWQLVNGLAVSIMSATNSEGDGPRGEPASAPSVSTASRAAGWWHVNKGGFPIPEETWEKMWQYIRDHHPNGQEVAKAIRGQRCKKVSQLRKIKQTQNNRRFHLFHSYRSLFQRSRISPPQLPQQKVYWQCSAICTLYSIHTIHITSRLHICMLKSSIYMWKFPKFFCWIYRYNHTGTQFFDIKKNRPLFRYISTMYDSVWSGHHQMLNKQDTLCCPKYHYFSTSEMRTAYTFSTNISWMEPHDSIDSCVYIDWWRLQRRSSRHRSLSSVSRQ